MELSTLIKSPLFIGGASTVGLGGAGIGGWVVYDGKYPTAHSQIKNQGFQYNSLDPSDLGVFKSGYSVNFKHEESPKTKPASCFKNFFPGAGPVSLNAKAKETTDPTPTEPSGTSSGTTTGCAMAQLAYRYEEEGSDDSKARKLSDFNFKSEVVFKNEKVGWAIWALGSGSKNNLDTAGKKDSGWGRQVLHYYVVFLEKVGNKWNIKGGYKGADTYGSDPSNREVQIEIDGEVGLDQSKSKTADTNGHTKQFIGHWSESSEGGKVILNSMDVQVHKSSSTGGQPKKQCELLCKEEGEHKEFKKRTTNYASIFYYPGFTKNAHFFFKNGNTGEPQLVDPHNPPQKDITAKLDKGFEPFKEKKGKGEKIADGFCDKTSSSRSPTENEMQKLKDYCYAEIK